MPQTKIARLAAVSVVAVAATAFNGAQTPYFVPIPSQGGGAVVSDPTIRPMQGPGSPASIFASRPVDLRGIGRPDMILCYGIVPPAPSQKMPIRILRPQPDGSLVDITRQLLGDGPLPGAVAPRVIVEGDFNEDGRVDIFVAGQGWDANPFPGEVNVLLLSNPDGTYADASANLPQQPDFTHDAAVGDVNGDGHLDVYVGNISGQQSVGPYFLLGNGDGTFTKVTNILPASITSTTEKFTACGIVDIDGDGHRDLVLGTHGDGGFLDSIILLNEGTGNFTVRPRLVLPNGPLGRGNTIVQGVGVLDINRDGRPDLILPSSQYSTFSGLGLQILINQGGGVLTDESAARLGSHAARFTYSPYQAPRFADLNQDGLTDFYFANGPVEPVPRYFLAESDGTFTPVPPSGPDALPPGLGFGVHAVSFDGAGPPDLVQMSHTSDGDVFYKSFLNRTVAPPFQHHVADIGTAPLKAPTTAAFAPGAAFTMEGWIFVPVAATSTSHLMGKPFDAEADPFQSFALQLWPGNSLVFALSNGTPGSLVFLQSPGAIPVGQWTHVAAVLDGGTMRIFVNGVQTVAAPAPGAPAVEPAVPFSLGLGFKSNGNQNNGRFPGYARSVRFWNVARTQSQIAAALNESLPAEASSLVAAWPLDENTGTVARDISGNERHLIVAAGSIVSARTADLAGEGGPFFATTTTAITDESLRYVNPKGGMIDVDRDGTLELIEVQGYTPSTYPGPLRPARLYRLVNGAFADVTAAVMGTVELEAPARTLVADFNGDNFSDALLVGAGTDILPLPGEQPKLLLNDGLGHLVNRTATHLPQHNDYAHDATSGDIDGDGDIDIFISNLNGGDGGCRVYINDGAGMFTEVTGRLPANIEDRTLSFTGCMLVDLTGDGRCELLLGGWPPNVPTGINELLLNNGSGTFVRPVSPLLPPRMFGSDGTVLFFVTGDLNQDGRTDLLLSCTRYYAQSGLQVLLQQVDGTFVDATAESGITWSAGTLEIDRVDLVDFNDDGRPDISAHFATATGHFTRLFLNRGDATFVEVTDAFTRSPVPISFHAGDIDGDGIVDLAGAQSNGVAFHRGLKPLAFSYFSDAPLITTQPVDKAVLIGGSATFTGSASGTPTPTYQWQKDGKNIPGANAGSLTIPSVSADDLGIYRLIATNDYGTAASHVATLAIATLPAITTHPASQTVLAGNQMTFSVIATGAPPLSYQWRKGGVVIDGATGSSLTFASAQPSDSGIYSVVVTNPAGSTTSADASLTVQNPTLPAFTTHPASQSINPGQPVTFNVTATGNPAPTYQWKFNGTDIAGATGASYTINSVQAANAGLYSVAATNLAGSLISNAATLTVNSPPVFTAHPASLVRNVGQSAQFTATATGTPTPAYQWKKDGVNIPGATNATFFIPFVFPGNAGTYTVVATNAAGSTPSNAATLTVNFPPSFTSHPASQTRTVGGSVTFSASASGVPEPAYQWRRNGANIPGATGESYTINPVAVASAGSYDVVATNAAGSATSNAAVLTVKAAAVPPAFTLHPAGKNVIAGQPVLFTSVATGDPAPTYQWRRNGVNIPGATGSSLAIADASGDDAGTYTVVATNSAGSATSNPAVLTVNFVGAAATGHAVGDLPGGAFFSQVRDATKVNGVVYAVGSSSMNGSALGDTAFLWSSTAGLTALPNLVTNTAGQSFITASAITRDAASIASRARNAPTGGSRTAVRVTRDGLVNLDLNAGAIPGLSAAVAISNDGSILYGLANNLNQAARFTAAGPTATLIPFPAPGHDRSAPAGRGTSSDGSVMIGTAATFAVTGGQSVGPGNAAFRYVHGTGTSAIPKPAGGTWSVGLAVSPDGNLALAAGDSTAVPAGELYIHNATAGTITPLGSPAPGWVPGNFGGMSADGAVAVVACGDPDGSQRASFLRNSHGWHDLRMLIAAKGIEVDGWKVDNVLGISPDATLVFGSGTHEGGIEGWVVEFAPGDLAAYRGEPPATTLAGVWSIGDTDGDESTVIVFNEDGTYFLIEDHSGGAGGASSDVGAPPMAAAVSNDAYGYEVGTYTWNPATGAFTATTLIDTNNDAGLSGLAGLNGVTASILGGTLTLHVPGPDGGDYTLARATDESPITGAWIIGDPASEDALTVVVFLADGTYYILSDGPDNDPSGQDGIEHGTYTWNPTTGALTTTVLFDSNGEWGLSHNDEPLAVFVEGGTLVAGAPGGTVLALSASIPALIAPVINDQPQGRSVGAGQPVSFNIAAVGTAPMTYQWFRNGTAIAGANAATYSIASAQPADAAAYSVVVANSAGSETSSAAALAVTSPPAITAQPAAKAVVNGATVSFDVAAAGSTPIAYQWRRNGVPIAGANTASLTLPSVTAANAGNYSVVIFNGFGSVVSSAAALTVGSDSRLTNISTRGRAGSGDATLIVGFYISGAGEKTLVIRGIGPKLLDHGVTSVVADPSIVVYSGQTPIASNNDWSPDLAADFGIVGAFPLDVGSKDAALKITLPTGGYTVHLVNAGTPAESLIEVYDRSKDAGTRLVNLSCRMKIAAGENIIAGTYLDGGALGLIVRNIGPGLAPHLPAAERPFVLPDPTLRFYNDADALMGQNDDWALATRPFFGPVGAFDLPDGSKDAAARLTINPGRYTVHASGNGTGGTLLVEFYAEP